MIGLLADVVVDVPSNSLHAEVVSPRLVNAEIPDAYSVRTLARHPQWATLNDRDFAARVTQWLGDRFHLTAQPAVELAEKTPALARINDPVRLWFGYGFGDERQWALVTAALWQASGRGPARIVEFREPGQTVVEVRSGDEWWLLDPVRQRLFLLSNTTLASVAHIVESDPAAIQVLTLRSTSPNTTADAASTGESAATDRAVSKPRGLTADEQASLKVWQKATRQTEAFAWATQATGDLILRPGDRFTRFRSAEGERFLLTDAQAKDKKLGAVIDQAPRGIKPLATPRTSAEANTKTAVHANVQLISEPPLKSAKPQPLTNAWLTRNVHTTPTGLTVAQSGDGAAVWSYGWPFPLTPEVGDLADLKDDQGAVVLQAEAENVTWSYSRDDGATWITIESKTAPLKADLTGPLVGRSRFLLRADFKGEPGKSLLKTLQVTLWGQAGPSTAAWLAPGENRFTLKTGDEFGLPTFPVVFDEPVIDENAFLRPVLRPPRELTPGDPNQRIKGPFTARLPSAPDSAIAWFELGGTFAAIAANPSSQDALTSPAITSNHGGPRGPVYLGFALDRPIGFKPLPFGGARSAEATGAPSSGTEPAAGLTIAAPSTAASAATILRQIELDGLVRLERPRPAVFVEAEGQPALNRLRMTAHCLAQPPWSPSPLTITHRWKDSTGTAQTAVAQPTPTGDYTVTVADTPQAQSVEFAVPVP